VKRVLNKIRTYAFCLRSAGIFAIYLDNGKKSKALLKADA